MSASISRSVVLRRSPSSSEPPRGHATLTSNGPPEVLPPMSDAQAARHASPSSPSASQSGSSPTRARAGPESSRGGTSRQRDLVGGSRLLSPTLPHQTLLVQLGGGELQYTGPGWEELAEPATLVASGGTPLAQVFPTTAAIAETVRQSDMSKVVEIPEMRALQRRRATGLAKRGSVSPARSVSPGGHRSPESSSKQSPQHLFGLVLYGSTSVKEEGEAPVEARKVVQGLVVRLLKPEEWYPFDLGADASDDRRPADRTGPDRSRTAGALACPNGVLTLRLEHDNMHTFSLTPCNWTCMPDPGLRLRFHIGSGRHVLGTVMAEKNGSVGARTYSGFVRLRRDNERAEGAPRLQLYTVNSHDELQRSVVSFTTADPSLRPAGTSERDRLVPQVTVTWPLHGMSTSERDRLVPQVTAVAG